MRSNRWLLVSLCAFLAPLAPLGCNGNGNGDTPKAQCDDGKDNDGDGLKDFPDDPGCVSAEDDSEDSPDSPQCNDGRDNDGDGKTDFPSDPGCFAPNQDDETDDCPDGPGCPQCSDGKDNDNNGSTDWPSDSGGCTSASDNDEYTENPAACGSNVTIKQLPFDNHATGTIAPGGASSLTSPTCGGAGKEDVYELRIMVPKVVVASTDSTLTSADTVLYIRAADCVNNTSEKVCNDDASATTKGSTVTVSLLPGTYYLVVDGHDSSSSGSYDLTVHFFVGEGTACATNDECGPGLLCRIPVGGTTKVCSKHVCEDGADSDGDGKNDYPTDPGCDAPTDDDETDTCPGAGCPECADGVDNDGDLQADYPNDTTCTSASSASEACLSSEGVTLITTAMTMGDTTGTVDNVHPTCASTANTAGDRTYRLNLPQMSTLSIVNTNTFDAAVALYNATCTGTPLSCADEPENIVMTNLAAGTYYYVVDGWSTGVGPYTITVSGQVTNGASCENALVQAGALTCGNGYACKGTVGSRTCQPALCSDGIDNDVPADGKIDYPFDPGCDSPGDDTEGDGATPPVCGNATDDDGDGQTDFPNDYGCAAASDTSEVFCMPETDPTSAIATHTTAGTTVGKANDIAATCGASAASDVTFGLRLPVPVVSLVIDTATSGYDTVLTFHDSHCAMEVMCNDDSNGTLQSQLTLSNIAAGNYAITVDGFSSSSGTFNLNVLGTVAPLTRCNSPLFAAGVLACPTGTTCTGSPLKCQ
jgi:hypothetical protein